MPDVKAWRKRLSRRLGLHIHKCLRQVLNYAMSAKYVPEGTSIEQIEKTYGHLLPDALDRGRVALEAFDARPAQTSVK